MKPLAIASSCIVLLVAGPALSNGRYPLANQLVVQPDNTDALVLNTTFGLALSSDRGQSWGWVCEDAAGIVGGEDAPIEVMQGGAIVVASPKGLSVGDSSGCTWMRPAIDADVIPVDADVDRSNPKRAVAIVAVYGASGTSSGLIESTDGGSSWTSVGDPFPGLPHTVALAPSKPDRIYVSGTDYAKSGEAAVLGVSDDGGKHLQTFRLPLEGTGAPFVGAVDPQNPDLVYVRALTATGTGVLLVSHDAGAHFDPIFEGRGPLTGFALSPDGSKVAVGGGVDALETASTVDYVFKVANKVTPQCLTWTEQGLYSCADEATDGFSLGISRDDGKTFDALFHKPDLQLQECPGTSPAGQLCPQAWVLQKPALQPGAPPPPDGLVGLTEPGDTGIHATGGGCRLARPGAQQENGWLWALIGLAASRRLRRAPNKEGRRRQRRG